MAKKADDIAAMLRRKFYELKHAAQDMFEQVSVFEDKDKKTRRRKQAEYIQKNASQEIWGLVFGLLDNKHMDELIWKVIKNGLKQNHS
jgi:hypothetical protein